MKKISSGLVILHKRIFPLFWFGFLAFFLVIVLLSDMPPAILVIFLGAPILMSLVGFLMMRKLVWDLVDEVYDCGDSLLVRKSDREERIALHNIMNISYPTFGNPQRVTLRLIEPGSFGAEVSFSPASQRKLAPFSKNPIVEDLILRVHAAKSGSSR